MFQFWDPWTYGTCLYNLWEISSLVQRIGFIPKANLKTLSDLKTRSESDRQGGGVGLGEGGAEGQEPWQSPRSGVGSLEQLVFSEDIFLETRRNQVFILKWKTCYLLFLPPFLPEDNDKGKFPDK